MMTSTNEIRTVGWSPGLFRTPDSRNYLLTFVPVPSLFLLWGFCSSLLDNLNKHFQNTQSLEVRDSKS